MARSSLAFVVIGCACAAVSAGCAAPGSAPPTNRPASATSASIRPEGAIHPAIQPSPASDLAGVLDKLQQVREIDPAAEQVLVEELRQTPPESWPLVAEQFRASLAYREQLAARNRIERPHEPTTVSDTRPSAPIGGLVDPRGAERDGVPSEALVRATPYSTPAVVPAHTAAEFDTNVPVSPISPSTVAGGSGPPAVVQASLATPTDESDRDGQSHDELDWQQHLERAVEDLSTRVAASPATTAEVHQHVSLRILRLLAGDTSAALEPIPHISPLEQDYWSRHFFALATYLDHHSQPDDKRRAAASVRHLDEAVAHLRELGSLTLLNLSFCKSVHGYGALEPYESDRFSPGQQVSLYVEVENYHSHSTEHGFHTLLGSTYEIINEEGERVAGGEFPDVEDLCRGRRRDFHIQYGLILPEKLAPGRYRLQLVVKDRQSEKLGQASVAFEIRGSRL